MLEIFERLEGLEVFGETVDFFQVGVLGERRPLGCLPGQQLPAAVLDGGE